MSGTRKEVKWSLNESISSGDIVSQQFTATATPDLGEYYNEVWLVVDGFGYEPYTWPTARIGAVEVFQLTLDDGSTVMQCTYMIGGEIFVVDNCVLE